MLKIRENTLQHLAFVIAITGLIALAYVSEKITPPLAELTYVDSANIGKNVRVQGSVAEIKEFSGGSALFSLSDGNSSVIFYLPYNVATEMDVSLLSEKRVEVTGTVKVYRGRVEVEVSGADAVVLLE